VSHCKPPTAIAGRFTPVSLLGRGGMGEVWLARDGSNGVEVALKRVSPENSPGPVGTRHRREFLNLSRLRHPSILHIDEYGIDSQDGARWFSSEVLRGPVSTEICKDISIQRWSEMCRGFLSALAFLHRNGWVHGDIKSDNVRLRNQPDENLPLDPVLLDFGLSHREGHPIEEKILGTAHSMPPEQWLGEPPDHRGDVYSAGVLFYQWWCGRLPFCGNDRSRLGRAHLQDDPPDIDQLRPGLPEQAICCLKKMLEKRPDDRPRDAGELWNLFQEFLPQVDRNCESESYESLAAQVRYAGPAAAQTSSLLEELHGALAAGGNPGIVLHLHRRGGDRRRIMQGVRTQLLSDGIPVISIDPSSENVQSDLSHAIVEGTELVVAMLEEPGLGSSELRSAMECRHIGASRVIWWVNCSAVPAGYLGVVLAKDSTRTIQTDADAGMELEDWLDRAIPATVVPSKLRSRLARWGQGSPAIWERILLGRIKAGQLTHDGLRWCWHELEQYPEDRWRIRVHEQASGLPQDELKILQALAILRAPATPSDVTQVAGIEPGQLPSLASKLVQKNWIRIDGDLHWCEPFQADGILGGIAAPLRETLHQRAAGLTGLNPLEQARHRLSAGDAETAATCLEPWLHADDRIQADADDLVEVLTPLVDILPDQLKTPWAELLGRTEDLLGQPGRRDRAWRICASFLKAGSSTAIRLARLRAHTTRRDGDPVEALRILENISETEKLETSKTVDENIRMAIEYSRVLRTLARRGLAPIQEFKDPGGSGDLLTEVRLEKCRCALARGARLQATDLADQVIEQANADRQARWVAEAQCLRARSTEDLRSLRIWSRLHQSLCRTESYREAAVVAGIESAESALRLGNEKMARQEISLLVDEARVHCRGQLPRALLLLARCEAGAGWIRSAANYLEEALSLDGPAGIVAWEGNLLVAASEWAAGRSRIARKILQSTPSYRAPHERQCIDVHCRHAILESRCAFSSGDPQQALQVIDCGITRLRLRGTARDVSPLRRERVDILERLGHIAMAQSERRRIAPDSIHELGTDPEPAGLRRAREALGRRRALLLQRGDMQKAARYLESAALDVLRLRAQPLSTWLTLERSGDLSSSERDRVASSAWKKVVRIESREGRAAVLLWWARSREQSGELESGSRLRQAALREVDRWQRNSPPGTRWNELAVLLGVPGLGSEALLGNGGCNAALA